MTIFFAPDIIEKVKEDYKDQSSQVIELISSLNINQVVELDRIFRSLLFLSNGNYEDLNKFLKTAEIDYRDILYWAEYDKNDNRIRDFSKPFK